MFVLSACISSYVLAVESIESRPFHQNLWLLSILTTGNIFCVQAQNISSPTTELISASHLDFKGHLKIQCYMWVLFSLFLSWCLASGDLLVLLCLANWYGKSIIHVNLQSSMTKKLSHAPMPTLSHFELCRVFSVKTAGVIELFSMG